MKWPVTRGERIHELQTINQHYAQTSQAANVNAAIMWHLQFHADELVPSLVVWFQDGVMKEETDISDEAGDIWTEVSGLPAFCCCITADQIHFRGDRKNAI